MAWFKLLRKILADFPGSFVLGEVRAETRHSSYANTLGASLRTTHLDKNGDQKPF